uniref:Potassium channel, subfamily K, member 4a n=1 Tax=Oryzias sinensis TaxID=183150 RepID=A0A8C7WZU7_9TELE
MRCTTLTTLLTGVMLYLGMGALVFVTLESPKESVAFEELLKTKKDFLINNTCVSEFDFHRLLKDVVSAMEAGLDVGNLPANLSTRWDMASAFFFCGTIITTIGFGNLSPRTWFGQLFCVCYALKRKVRPTTVRVISAVLSILIGCLIFLAVPTVVFQKVERWSFLESLYFVVITLTTVGFGDYVPGGANEGGNIFKPLVLLWIVFGLAYFASILTMIGNWLRVLSKKTRAEMEELRAHATDWTQNMSMDFRIPNPLEFNDPFLLQRRRWKRSERRRIRRGAQGTLGYWIRGGSENGHLPNHWPGLSSSLSRLEGRSSLEKAVVAKFRPRLSADTHVIVRTAAGGGNDPAVNVQRQGRSLPPRLGRSLSVPVACSTSELDSMGAAMPDRSLSGSGSWYDSRSDGSSVSLSLSIYCNFQPGHSTTRSREKEEGEVPQLQTSQEKNEAIPAESFEPVANGVQSNISTHCFSHLSLPFPSELPSVLTPSLSNPTPVCQPLDFFGENLAYIDESSDALSDKMTEREEKRRRPRKPKRRSMRRQLPHRSTPQVNNDLQPPSNPPTPPPVFSASDFPPSGIHTDSAPAL